MDILSAPAKSNRDNKAKSTQTYLRIGEIKDDTIVLKNGGLRGVISTSSVNFNLKSEPEQNAMIQAYQGFLNSLEFPIQILVRSKKLDIDNYIETVKELAQNQQNKLLQDQTYEYADYIAKLVEYADIMEKHFYVIVPLDPPRVAKPNAFQAFFQRLQPKDTVAEIKKRAQEFEDLRKKLTQRLNTVRAGLENCGLKTEELNTEQIIELLYGSYNPITSRGAKLKNLDEVTLESENQE